jgi:hypothetical protein
VYIHDLKIYIGYFIFMREHILFIDSRNAQHIKSNVEFSVLFNENATFPGEIYKNVVSVELTGISIQNDNLTTEPYVILDIEELNNRINSNVPLAHKSFCIIYLDTTVTSLSSSSTHTQLIKGQDFDAKIRNFIQPLDSLSRLTIRILTGNPASPINPNYMGFVTMIFKIKTLL